MIGIGGALSSTFEISNEIGKLKSFSLVYRTIKNLDFEVSYFVDEGLNQNRTISNCPFCTLFLTPQFLRQLGYLIDLHL